MGEFESQSLKNEIWEARWEADVRAAKALAILKNKDLTGVFYKDTITLYKGQHSINSISVS